MQTALNVALNGEQISALRADADSLHRVFVGTGSGGVYRIDSAHIDNPTVTDITGDIGDFGYISSIDLGPTDDEIIITLSNYGVSSVWYTVDGGVSWSNKDNDGSLPDIPVRWALLNPNDPRQVMLATELGVWSTSDISASNPNWEQTSVDLANVRCDMLQYRSADKQVVVATHGRGLFTTDVFSGPIVEAPSDFTIEETADGISLSWVDNATNEVSYTIERAVGEEEFDLLENIGANSAAYLDASLDETNIQVSYRITAIGDQGKNSSSLSGSILILPAAPVLGDITNVTPNSFTMNWIITDGAAISVIDVSTDESFESYLEGLEQLRISPTSYTLFDVDPATYFYRVAASNDAGISTYSETGSITIEALGLADQRFEVYPNPTHGVINIEGSLFNSLILMDLSGKVLTEYENQNQVDLTALMSGTYLLKIRSNEKEFIHRIVLK